MNISGLVCAISSRLWGLPPRIDNSFFIFFHKFLALPFQAQSPRYRSHLTILERFHDSA